jgi:hypothetical protein
MPGVARSRARWPSATSTTACSSARWRSSIDDLGERIRHPRRARAHQRRRLKVEEVNKLLKTPTMADMMKAMAAKAGWPARPHDGMGGGMPSWRSTKLAGEDAGGLPPRMPGYHRRCREARASRARQIPRSRRWGGKLPTPGGLPAASSEE